MLPEDRLDALLSLHAENSPGQPSANGYAEFADLQPLLDASARLEGLRNAEPTPEFAGHLETLFLATAASLREQSEGGESAVSFSGDIASRYADGAPPRLVGEVVQHHVEEPARPLRDAAGAHVHAPLLHRVHHLRLELGVRAHRALERGFTRTMLPR